uniref:Uncharacterized protein n=1 Tax=Ditylum brightwellii TaxID=49249 RepID=A0A7S1VZG3_9STRA
MKHFLLLLAYPLTCFTFNPALSYNVATQKNKLHTWHLLQRHRGWKTLSHANPSFAPSVVSGNLGSFATSRNAEDAETAHIDYQSDESSFGRGEDHLSAVLDEGDVVVYQTGTWSVDGVEVGDGSPPQLQYAKVDTIQLVWTHNCEHGVIRGIVLDFDSDKVGENNCRVAVSPTYESVEFGPEQLVARLPVQWDEDNEDEGILLATLPRDLILS